MPTKYVYIDDLAINVAHTGSTTLPGVPPPLGRGATLLFLHGEGGCAALWARQLEHFAAQHSPVAIDLPAHGRSSALDGPDSIGGAAEIVATALQLLGAPPAFVVGHGSGGHIALELASRRPDRVRGVVTIGSAACPEIPDAAIDRLRQVVKGRIGQQFDTPFFGASPDFAVMREFWTEMVKTDPKVRLTDLLAYRCSDARAVLGRISQPVLVIHGEADQLCTRLAAEELAGGIAGARLVVIPGAGHVAHLEKPAEVNAAIEGLVAA